ncbi:MAG: LysR family transcriptional regulator [Thalassobaculaceae bacterium]|nr:LysR family transcriptional regulator [Thalassobaculaceae bacterium]
MTPDELRSFLTAYELGSLKKAAGQMNLTQPTLSRRIQRLEDVLGVILFLRSPSGLTPTAYGHALARRARLVVQEIELARREMARIRTAAGGSVAFGASPGVAVGWLPAALDRLAHRHPDTNLTVVESVSESLVDQVIERRIDFAVCTAPLDPSSDLSVEHLGRDPFVVAAHRTHPLLARAPVPLAATLEFPWIMATFRGAVRHWVETRFEENGLPAPPARIETSSMMMLKQVLDDARHLSYLPARLIAADCPDIVALPCNPGMVLQRDLALIRVSQRALSPASDRVIDVLRETIEDLPPLRIPGL